jgi:alpha-tubulin suppressor-like RCC1 family protein
MPRLALVAALCTVGSLITAADAPPSAISVAPGYVTAEKPSGQTSFFTPVDKPTPMYFKPPPEAPLLKTPINTNLNWIGNSEYHEFFIIDGTLFGLGGTRAGMMGLGDTIPTAYVLPQRVHLPEKTVMVAAAAGGYQSLGIDASGRVWSWGHNTFGQRGDGSLPKPGTDNKEWGVPTQLTTDAAGKDFAGPADPATQVLSVLWYVLACTKGGAVYMWGMNGPDGAGNDSRGVIGDGKPMSEDKSDEGRAVRRPSRVVFPQGTVVKRIAASSSMAMAVDTEGRLWTWGGGGEALGVGDGKAQEQRGAKGGHSSTPLQVQLGRVQAGAPPTPLPRIIDASSNTVTNFAVDANGDLWGWGIKAALAGIPGPDWNPQSFPVKLTRSGNPHFTGIDALLASGRKVKNVQVSLTACHVLLDDGSLWCWGDSAMGAVGDGHIVNYLMVKPQSDGKNKISDSWDWGTTTALVRDATRVLTHVRYFCTSAFSFHVMAVREDGTLWSWGRDANGVLGNKAQPYAEAWHPNHADFERFKPMGESYTPNYFDVPYPMRVQPF